MHEKSLGDSGGGEKMGTDSVGEEDRRTDSIAGGK